MNKLTVDLGARSYPIYIGKRLLDPPDLLERHIGGRQVLIVTNDTVAKLYLVPLQQALARYQVSVEILPDGEQYKNLQTLSRVYDRLLADRHSRSTTLIALGGGVIGDITGFAAATYQRGVNFIQIPTTLLAQVDSSVGGKTGVNHPLAKNMIGAFHQPQCVVVATDVLSTLPPREFSAGLAEVIKYGLIADAPFFEWLESNIDRLVQTKDSDRLVEAIRRSCENKAKVVAEDEFESNRRAILNLGHTFGHAIETGLGYGQWLHGEAVAVGMLMAVTMSARLGWLTDSDVIRVRDLLARAGLPTVAPLNLTAEQYLSHMAVDKKVLDGNLRLVLLRQIGQAVVSSDFPRQLLVQSIDHCR